MKDSLIAAAVLFVAELAVALITFVAVAAVVTIGLAVAAWYAAIVLPL